MRNTSPARAVRTPAIIIAAIAGAIACGEAPPISAPSAGATQLAAPQAVSAWKSSSGERLRMPVLARTRILRHDEVACRTLGAASGDATIELRRAGLSVTFPAGSVPATTNICLIADAGRLLTYSFEPHGLQFTQPITVTQDLQHTTAWHDAALGAQLTGGYLEGGVAADVDAGGVGDFAELFTTSVYDDLRRENRDVPSVASFQTVHFSGYALASGKSDTTSTKTK